MSNDPRWLDLTAAAAYLSLRPDIFARKVKAGIIPAAGSKRGEHLMWNTADIDAMMLAGIRQVTPKPPRKQLPFEGVLLSLSEVLGQAEPWAQHRAGIYFLIHENAIAYIGQSIDVTARVIQHSGEKMFDRWYWIPCELSRLNATERAYIRAFKPPLNKTLLN